MSDQSTSAVMKCPHCGQTIDLDGSAHHAHALVTEPTGKQRVLRSAAYDVFHLETKLGYLADLWYVLKHPINGPVEIALAQRNHGQAVFFLLGLAWVALLAKIPNAIPPSPVDPSADAFIRLLYSHETELAIVMVYLVMTFALLFSYRRLAKRSPVVRSARQFTDMSFIWFGLYCLYGSYDIVPNLLALAKVISPERAKLVSDSAFIVLPGLLIAEVHGVLINRRFWQISAGRAIYITVTAALMAIAVSFALLLAFGFALSAFFPNFGAH